MYSIDSASAFLRGTVVGRHARMISTEERARPRRLLKPALQKRRGEIVVEASLERALTTKILVSRSLRLSSSRRITSSNHVLSRATGTLQMP